MSNYKVFYQQIEESKRNSTFNLIHQLKTEEQMERQLKERVPSLETYQAMTEEEQNEFSQTLETLFGTTELWETVKTKHIVVIESSAEIGGTVFAFYDELEPKKETPITERIYRIYDVSTYGMFSPEGLAAFIKYQQEYKKGEQDPYAIPIENGITLTMSNAVISNMHRTLSHITVKKHVKDHINKNEELRVTIPNTKITLSIPNFSLFPNGVNENAKRLYEALIVKSVAQGLRSTLVTLPVKEYANLCDINLDERSYSVVYREIREGITMLQSAQFETETFMRSGEKGKKEKKLIRIGILQPSAVIKVAEEKSARKKSPNVIIDGEISARFDEVFFAILKEAHKMQLPLSIFRFNARVNPYASDLLRKLTEHRSMNTGKWNQNIVSVQTLLKECYNRGMPKPEEVKNYKYQERIMEPFNRDMEKLEGDITWEYRGKKGALLSDETIENFGFNDFLQAEIFFKFKHGFDEPTGDTPIKPTRVTSKKRRRTSTKKQPVKEV